ncbi:MAG: 4'-phosphopantetheinyl transferase superfamily protein [Actinomycetota bacterium]|nr:4'-phosphopantetheinyl transferase superfamily protein [Actinomycetota bacterium]
MLLDRPWDAVGRLGATLSRGEKTRASRFHFPLLRSRFIVAHAALRSILASYCSTSATAIRFATEQYGKPVLAGVGGVSSHGSSPPVEFSLSHSDGCALVAVTHRRAVGVDVERISAEIDDATLARRYFAPEERESLERCPPPERTGLFFRYWVGKESYIKATGFGLLHQLDQFVVDFSAGRIVDVGARPSSRRTHLGWHVQELGPPQGYVAAVTVKDISTPVTRLAWSPQPLA